MADEAYPIKVGAMTAHVKRFHDGTATVICGDQSVLLKGWTPADILDAAKKVTAAVLAQRAAKAEREKIVADARALAHAENKAKGTVTA